MGRRAWAVVLLGLACRTAAPAPERADLARVSSLELQFPEPGKGELSFALAVPGTQVKASATLVRWELWLKGRPFASGITRLPEGAAQGQPPLVAVHETLLYGPLGYDAQPHRLQVRVLGEVTALFASGDVTVAFDTETRLDVLAAPVLESPDG